LFLNVFQKKMSNKFIIFYLNITEYVFGINFYGMLVDDLILWDSRESSDDAVVFCIDYDVNESDTLS
jgi:hypothetical protein